MYARYKTTLNQPFHAPAISLPLKDLCCGGRVFMFMSFSANFIILLAHIDAIWYWLCGAVQHFHNPMLGPPKTKQFRRKIHFFSFNSVKSPVSSWAILGKMRHKQRGMIRRIFRATCARRHCRNWRRFCWSARQVLIKHAVVWKYRCWLTIPYTLSAIHVIFGKWSARKISSFPTTCGVHHGLLSVVGLSRISSGICFVIQFTVGVGIPIIWQCMHENVWIKMTERLRVTSEDSQKVKVHPNNIWRIGKAMCVCMKSAFNQRLVGS